MTVQILGRREDQHLELKSRDALDAPDMIARAVVGMLNADGGTIWIGVDEKDSTAVSVTPVPGAARARERLMDSLLDMLEPSPTADEIAISLEPVGADPALLVVHVRAPGEASGRRPFALRKGGGWHFLRRVGARNHPMSRQEIFGRRAGGGQDQEVGKAVEALERDRTVFQQEGGTGLWVGLQPARSIHLDSQLDSLAQIGLDAKLTGNRRAGWHFARTTYPPKLTKDGIEWGVRMEATGEVTAQGLLTERGGARFQAELDWLQWKGEEREIWPYILLEYPISAFRIARVIYNGLLKPTDRVASGLALFGIGGWGLRPGSPGHFFRENEIVRMEEPDLLWEPTVFRFGEIDEHPDRCGFRLVRRVYQAFGFRESDMPREYDVETGRLLLPE